MVVFPHPQHTEWLDCLNYHEKIFVAKTDGNDFGVRLALASFVTIGAGRTEEITSGEFLRRQLRIRCIEHDFAVDEWIGSAVAPLMIGPAIRLGMIAAVAATEIAVELVDLPAEGERRQAARRRGGEF